MDLTYREVEPRDFEACLELMQDREAYSEEALIALPEIWKQWLVTGALNATVLEYREGPSQSRIIQFGMTVFVTDAFMAEARSAETPHITVRLIDQVLAGNSPVLDLTAIRKANSGHGLNLFVLHFELMTAGWTPDELLLILVRIPDSFFWLHHGYYVQEFLFELCGTLPVQFCRNSGLFLRSDYRDFCRQHGLPLPPSEQHPHLFGFTREEAAANPGAYIAKMFPYHTPRFFFSYGEQKVLLQAMLGRNDEEIAATLDVALSTVKKRWTAMYECVSGQLPEMFAEATPVSGLSRQNRGQEKRRHLLAYLRQHPEELRPCTPPAD